MTEGRPAIRPPTEAPPDALSSAPDSPSNPDLTSNPDPAATSSGSSPARATSESATTAPRHPDDAPPIASRTSPFDSKDRLDPKAFLTKLQLGGLVALRAAVSAAVLLAGFRAVSDDDYARVVLAQTWARAPKLDPTGTSWLPFPFWLNGAAMLAFGRSLFVAQAVAFVLGIVATLLIALGALRVTADRRAAFVAAAFATLVGWSAWLGVATVPEGLTAALTFFAASSLTTRSPRARAFGALALLAATLSRYEPWPVAIAFAVWNLIDRVGWPLRGASGARGATANVVASRAPDQGSNEDAPSLARRTKKARNVAAPQLRTPLRKAELRLR